MTHYVIGGDGFVGRHLAAELVRCGERVVIADLQAGPHAIYEACEYQRVDVCDVESIRALKLGASDIVHHLAARQYHGDVPRRGRNQYFNDVNVAGTASLLEHMAGRECNSLVYFSSDMVYGMPESLPVTTSHPQRPLGPYGESKRQSEAICRAYRARGMRITILRPRLIVGPGRLGILARLFELVTRGLPVPLIGNGSNYYQMVSVHDCVTAVMCALHSGLPNDAFNLGSRDPPSVRELLSQLIVRAKSRSRLVTTPARLTKLALMTLDSIGVTLLHREQYAIADVTYLLDTSHSERELGWTPAYRDEDMVFEAFERFRTRSMPI